MKKAFTLYDLQVRERNPIKTKMLTCFILFCLGDVTCQMLEFKKLQNQQGADKSSHRNAASEILLPQEKFRWDSRRTVLQGTSAAVFNNPVSQLYLAKVAPLVDVSRWMGVSTLGNVLNNATRACVHFFCMSPFQISLFFGGNALLDTWSFEAAAKNVADKYWVTYNIAKFYWPCANFLVYQFAPVHMR
mmetsp:Transcript_4675/g.7948  ORF Transcript_4675/g.7948 Transcript_4675/m.7948 type:complete len:189 (+) Transcript_4675:79-645(+)|eukprot:CAMPEP_0168627238 /NCGR_PEP_ID=MMETSP0449_2-20121227/11115_1 /TAXON_ID=1082188 /ORGANISM="Strombidium rassoulzadegani, Strain ras09" /LENGTH=188 /DNA_ID=CAMNT_0008669399 /DNA_START=49 /DNA_END=615 /DNA_ORIENTATION=+